MKIKIFALVSICSLAGQLVWAQEREEIKPRQPGDIRPNREQPRGPVVPPSAPAIDPHVGPGGGGSGGGGFGGNGPSPFQSVSSAVTRMRELFNPPPRSLVVSVPARESDDVANLEEDLEVMSRILDKAAARSLGQNQDPRYMGITIPGLSAGRTPQNFYIDGYGAMFVLNVRFPLAAGEPKAAGDAQRPNNSTWEQARREVRGGGPVRPESRQMEYSEEKVEALKKELIVDLKNATNIRGLPANEAITVVVTGEGGREFEMESIHTRTTAGNSSNVSRSDSKGRRDDNTTMTLRVKKSDVDAFANGKIDLNDFRNKVSVAIY